MGGSGDIPAGAHPLNAHFIIHASGRWNRPGEYGCLYTALAPETAEAEHRKARDRAGIFGERPREIVGIDVMVAPVLDLTSRTRRRRLGVRSSDLRSDEDEGIEACRAIADAARAEGYRGILAPSAAGRDGRVLVIYLEGPPAGLDMQVPDDRRSL